MAQQPIVYEIDDSKSADENIAALGAALTGIDEPLAAVLAPALAGMSNSGAADNAVLLNALYEAAAPEASVAEEKAADEADALGVAA
jgi:hypothetical protein